MASRGAGRMTPSPAHHLWPCSGALVENWVRALTESLHWGPVASSIAGGNELGGKISPRRTAAARPSRTTELQGASNYFCLISDACLAKHTFLQWALQCPLSRTIMRGAYFLQVKAEELSFSLTHRAMPRVRGFGSPCRQGCSNTTFGPALPGGWNTCDIFVPFAIWPPCSPLCPVCPFPSRLGSQRPRCSRPPFDPQSLPRWD